MSVILDQKEDLRLRMADLEKKLAESEEERCKLEKTCNVLLKAFREEERMHYKALNQKYERFLEDCTMRKRRNDIILRSLCRIEDRSRALFAKTERLKLLKDRYISYLNVSDFKKEDIHSHSTWRSVPFSSPKYVQWTTPLATHLKTERLRNAVRHLLEADKTSDLFPAAVSPNENVGKSEEKQRDDGGETNVFNATPVSTPRVGGMLTTADANSYSSNLVPRQMKNDRTARMQTLSGNHVSRIDKPEKVTGYHESEVLKKGFPSEGNFFNRGNTNERHDPSEGELEESAHVEQSGKASVSEECKSNDAPRVDYNWSCGPNIRTREEEKREKDRESESDCQEGDVWDDGSPESLPKGLDGVDYQNETYPESYYEQPVHHNHTSIASDVILEEDETEQDVDEGREKDLTPGDGFRESGGRSPGHGAVGEPRWETETNKQMGEPNKGQAVVGGQVSEVRSRGSESEKSSDGKQSDGSERPTTEKSDKKKGGVRSNLIHLLESDSESFQIEHGDGISGNDDSDFDFSFHQN